MSIGILKIFLIGIHLTFSSVVIALKTAMKTVNTAELKNEANRLLDLVDRHQTVIVTRRGHPCAALIPLNDKGLEDLIWEYSPEVQRRLKKSEQEMRRGKTTSLPAFAKKHGLLT